ncbi:MAG: hypothetical protein RKO25_15660, partial [Candidatus Contendobacter sp.]|nr:hypothetical protein [Candidatus Contendobacter sp.]
KKPLEPAISSMHHFESHPGRRDILTNAGKPPNIPSVSTEFTFSFTGDSRRASAREVPHAPIRTRHHVTPSGRSPEGTGCLPSLLSDLEKPWVTTCHPGFFTWGAELFITASSNHAD